jgi:prepilin-type processing-associated H-X9-DG protein
VRVSIGGAYGSQPAFTQFAYAWYRGSAPGNGGSGIDARLFGFRHGVQKPNGGADLYRMNAGFFDGHVEALGDLEACNPQFWIPKGGSARLTAGQLFNDVRNKYAGRYTQVDPNDSQNRIIFD